MTLFSKWFSRIGMMVLMCAVPLNFAFAAEIRVAVTVNLKPAMQEIQKAYEGKTRNTLQINYGSSGKFYTEIKQGFPFAVLVAGDTEHPQKLETEQFAVEGTRFTYAVGYLVLWSSKIGVVDDKGEVLKGDIKKIALPNPKLSSYGVAAQEVLQSLQLWDKLSPRLVLAEHSQQVYQFVSAGSVDLGFTALSELKARGTIPGSYWKVPADLYKPLEQQAVLLKTGKGNKDAEGFLEYLKTPESQAVIEKYGYGKPTAPAAANPAK